MANEILKYDQNSIRVLAGVTDDTDKDITMLRVDPITKRLLVKGNFVYGSISWGSIIGTITNQTDLINYIDGVINTDSGWTKTGTNVHLTTITDNVGVGTITPVSKLNSREIIYKEKTRNLHSLNYLYVDTVEVEYHQKKNGSNSKTVPMRNTSTIHVQDRGIEIVRISI